MDALIDTIPEAEEAEQCATLVTAAAFSRLPDLLLLLLLTPIRV